MREETIYNELKQEIHGLKDPGNALIVVYILLVLILLLFAGLQSAKADFQSSKEGTFSIEHRRMVSPPERHSVSPHYHFHYIEVKPSSH
jgi:hypothetical protein